MALVDQLKLHQNTKWELHKTLDGFKLKHVTCNFRMYCIAYRRERSFSDKYQLRESFSYGFFLLTILIVCQKLTPYSGESYIVLGWLNFNIISL